MKRFWVRVSKNRSLFFSAVSLSEAKKIARSYGYDLGTLNEVIGYVALKGKLNGNIVSGSFPIMKGQTRAQAEKLAVKTYNSSESCSGFKVVPNESAKPESAKERSERLGKGRRNR